MLSRAEEHQNQWEEFHGLELIPRLTLIEAILVF